MHESDYKQPEKTARQQEQKFRKTETVWPKRVALNRSIFEKVQLRLQNSAVQILARFFVGKFTGSASFYMQLEYFTKYF